MSNLRIYFLNTFFYFIHTIGMKGVRAMLLLKLAYDEQHDISEDIREISVFLKQKGITVGICESMEGNTDIAAIVCEDSAYSEKLQSLISFYCSNILYKIVIENFKTKEFLEYVTENYFFLSSEEIIEIEYRCMKTLSSDNVLLNDSSVYCLNIINNMIEKIRNCIDEQHNINVEGFLRFRMKDLVENIEAIIDKVVEEYMVEKEYDEFIKLLKYFVDIQESKMNILNIVMLKDGAYELFDENENNIFETFVNSISDLKTTNAVKEEDIIISGLITNSPSEIVIHNKENCCNQEFLNTIENVFGDRVKFCNGCNMCRATKTKI